MEVNGCSVIKAFISSVKEYNKQRTEAISQKLQRYLQILSTIADTNVFDPNNTDSAEFYVCLYDLMSTLDSRTGLMWCAVSVLEEASKNAGAKNSLIHKYKFTPILTELLSGHLIYDKQIRVLRLIQEFTYGVEILWQDAHLPLLISILIKWIKDNDKCSELVSLSLGVLVNLCYKNLPAIYVLQRVIDIKEFMKSILRQVKDNLDIRVQAYKMLIILEEVSGEISDQEILSFVTWTFKRIHEALETGNVNAMRHVVDFFKDIIQNSNFKNVLLKYERYSADTEGLLVLLEHKKSSMEESECVMLFLEFVQSIILLETSNLERLYESLIKLTLNLTEVNSRVSGMALQLISTIVAETRRNGRNNHFSIIKQLDAALPMLLSSLNAKDGSGLSGKNSITALLSLLLEMSQEPTTRKQILSSLQPAVMKSHFLTVLSPDSENESLLDESSSPFYLQGLSLVASLSSMDENWSCLFNELMRHKKLKMRLAASLYTGSPQVKCQVLKLIAHLGQDNRLLVELSYSMSELNKLVAPVTAASFNFQQDHSTSTSKHCSMPLLSLAQQSRLDQCIATLQQAVSNNQLGSVGTAAVLELYEYRVAAMSHTESVLQGNLQVVDKYCTQLRHRVSVMTSEMNKLLSILHSKEESFETLQRAVTSLQHDLLAAESSLQSLQSLYAQAVEDLKLKSTAADELSDELKSVKITLKEKQEENVLLTDQLQVKCKEFEYTKAEMMKELQDKNEDNRQLSEKLKEMTSVVQDRDEKIKQHEGLIKHLEKSVFDKDNEIVQYQAEIAELEAMRKIIMEVAKKNKERSNE